MRELADILADWQRHIRIMADAITARNYDFFTVAFRDGCRCYDELHEIMESNLRKEWQDAHRAEIVAVTQEWLNRAEDVKIWMAEIEQEAKRIRRSHAVGRKLSDAYGHICKSGNNLRLSR